MLSISYLNKEGSIASFHFLLRYKRGENMEENKWDKVKELGKMTESFIQKCLIMYL